MSPWFYLAVGIVLEVAGTTCLKISEGFSVPLPTVLCLLFFAAALFFIALSVKALEVSVVYAIWSGVGVVLITFVGVFYFQESVSMAKLAFIALIVIGVTGLHLVTEEKRADHGDTAEQ